MGEGFSVWPAATEQLGFRPAGADFSLKRALAPKYIPVSRRQKRRSRLEWLSRLGGRANRPYWNISGLVRRLSQPAAGPARYVCSNIQLTLQTLK